MHIRKAHIILIILLSIISHDLKAQFYNGYQVQFGKNRVQYDIFEWVYYRHEKFDTYFYDNGSELALFVSEVAKRKIKEYESFFEYSLNERVIFQVYNNLSDFRQSNIGYASNNSNNSNIGGTTTIFLNRASLYFEGDFQKFEEQISEVVAELYINQMLLGGSLTRQVANSTLLSLPNWYTKGLIKYLSEEWNTNVDDQVKDAFLSGKFDRFNNLSNKEELLAGQSIWNYIANRYGKNVIPNIVYISRISKSVENGFVFVIGTSFKQLIDEWMAYYYEQYSESNENRTSFNKNNRLFKTKLNRVYQHLKVSPINGNIAYTTNELGRYIIWVYNPNTGKRKRLLRKEHRLQQITDYTYPLLAWHPRINKLGYMFEQKGGIWFGTYDFNTKEREEREIFKFIKINQFEFSNDNKNLIMTAVREGQSDIYLYNLLANTYKQITKDKAEEKWASYIKNSSSILFASNRLSDSIQANQTQKTYDLFIYDPNLPKLRRVTNTPKENEVQAQEIEKFKFLYLTDKNGIKNLAQAKYDSTINFVDTVIHYKYYANKSLLTNYNRNILDYHYDNQELKILNHWNKKDRYFSSNFTSNNNAISNLTKTNWKVRKEKNELKDSLLNVAKDSIAQIQIQSQEPTDTNNIDFYNYTFDINKLTKKGTEEQILLKQNSAKKKSDDFTTLYYFTSFYKDNLITQIDFQFLNEFYQTYTGTAIYQNPGMNLHIKLGVADLFEDYRFTAAAKIGIDLNSNEFLFSLENNKKRLDKQYVFYRQTFSEPFTDYYSGKYYLLKNYSHQFQYRLRYPFSQVASVRATLSYRNDLVTWKATNAETLLTEDKIKNWVGTKLEYVFDNALSLGVNLNRGWKIKLFVEAYVQAEKKLSDLYVAGFDFRHYQKIHRNLIWASRIAGSSSLGKNRLIYYLGSTDNWIKLSTKTPQFDESVKRNKEINWAFQSLATNMRGFPQNVRNGNTFFVANNEIRFPIFNYFSRTPLSSSFLKNFQIIGFFDIGTAWTGLSPYDKKNKYNIDTKIEQPISIIIDNQKSPFVYGYGTGIRTKLLGYFIRGDIAWGIDGDVRLKPIFYLSLSLDF